MKRLISILMVLLALGGTLHAQSHKGYESFNMQRAIAHLQQDDDEGAYNYLMRELDDNPKNGYAHLQMAWVLARKGSYQTAVDQATLAIKYIPKGDKESVCQAYELRGRLYYSLEDYVSGLNDFDKCVSFEPDNAEYYNHRADGYSFLDQKEKARQESLKVIKLDPNNAKALTRLGIIAFGQEKFEEAIRYFDRSEQVTTDNFPLYLSRATVYLDLKNYDAAARDVVRALALDKNQDRYLQWMAHNILQHSKESLMSRLMIQANKEPSNFYWPYQIGMYYQYCDDYAMAIEWLAKANNLQESETTFSHIAQCYYELGVFDQALKAIDKAIERDNTFAPFYATKADICYELMGVDSSIALMDQAIALAPEFGWYYHHRGWHKSLKKDYEGALEDLTASVSLIPDYAYNYSVRGDCYHHLGDEASARRDYRKAIECDTIDSVPTCAYYAQYYLGNEEEAIRLLNKSLESKERGAHYDAACLYSEMGKKNLALEHLRKAFEEGWCRFRHLELDSDLDNIRQEPEYKVLVKEYKAKHEEAVSKVIRLY
ncbi:MAG: hypothetical protein KBT04_06725 [Bacteroidales bacterium]|nr:hypothetical protein [Candidatus Colimorpha onthohippi]